MTRMKWQRQRAEDDAVRQIIIMPISRQGTNDAMTTESIQAMIDRAIQRNSTTRRICKPQFGERNQTPCHLYILFPKPLDFMKCQHINFKGTEGIMGLSQWIEKMESVFHISSCAIENQVKFATCTLLGAALTCLHSAFPKLALMCTKFLTDETAKIDKYISGLPDNIHGNVMSARPKTPDFTIELANDLMDQKLRTYAER
ncbi:hypothetical protein Tco_1103794 [Tanacetum coccineum]